VFDQFNSNGGLAEDFSKRVFFLPFQRKSAVIYIA